MSASLVGSEMCIRDRRAASSDWACGKVSGIDCANMKHVQDHCAVHSVSYTHLTLPTICSV
eukprot:14826994-Alexandrium_andersonii.AAC.1